MSYTPRRMDPDDDGTLWRAVVTYTGATVVEPAWGDRVTETYGPYKTEPTAVGMISRLKNNRHIMIIEAHTESADTHWKRVEDF